MEAIRIGVIGGGISGLAAAHRLRELTAGKPAEVTLFEASGRLGGVIATQRSEGFVVEAGPDAFLSEKPWATALARRLGLEAELIGTRSEFRATLVAWRGRLFEVPEGFMMMAPRRLGPLVKSALLSPLGKLRMALEPLVPARGGDQDETVGAFVRRRLGAEALNRLVGPLVGAVYGADVDQLSMAATMPRFWGMEREYKSLFRGLRAAAASAAAGADGVRGARFSLFVSFRDGMQTLCEALAGALGAAARVKAEVVELVASRASDGARRWYARLGDGAEVELDGVICAAPAWATARLLKRQAPELAAGLERIPYATAAVATYALEERSFLKPPRMAGIVVAPARERRAFAVSFPSLKFPGRAPPGAVLVRVFLRAPDLAANPQPLGQEALARAGLSELRALLGVGGEPLWSRVALWPRAMAHYAVGHLQLVDRLEQEAAAIGAIALAGSAYRGVGVPDCIHSGELAAERLLGALAASRQGPGCRLN